MAAKGGKVGDITPGDCLELSRLAGEMAGSRGKGMYFYQLLRGTGVFPAGEYACCWGTWLVGLLPYAEQKALYDQYKYFGSVQNAAGNTHVHALSLLRLPSC